MRRVLLAAWIATFSATCAAADAPAAEKTFTVKVSTLIPYRWFVEEITVNAVPYGFGIQEDWQRGTCLKLVGPTVVKGPRGINEEPESVYFWIMAADYTFIPPTGTDTPQFMTASPLGSNETIAVYAASFTSGTPSWTTWEEDIVHRLGLSSAHASKAAVRERYPVP